MNAVRYAVARLKEPSTYTGLAALLAIFGYNLDPGVVQAIVGAGVGVAGLAAMLLREGSPAAS